VINRVVAQLNQDVYNELHKGIDSRPNANIHERCFMWQIAGTEISLLQQNGMRAFVKRRHFSWPHTPHPPILNCLSSQNESKLRYLAFRDRPRNKIHWTERAII
jgi:hypothetical protein